MPSPRMRAALALIALLGVGAYVFPPQRRGVLEAVLEVDVAARGPAPGLAAALYVLRLRGPATMEADGPRLGDATASWKADWRASSWRLRDEQAELHIEIHLRQIKPGPVPLPDLRLRMREGPESPWQEVEWIDILRQTRPGPPPERYTPQHSAPWWIGPGAAATGVVLGMGVWVLLRRRPARSAPVSPLLRALKELDRLEQSALPPATDSATFHTQVSEVVRRFLMEHFGLPALERTTAEFLQTATRVPQLTATADVLREFCDRCDLAKFAGTSLTAEECRATLSLARRLIESTDGGAVKNDGR